MTRTARWIALLLTASACTGGGAGVPLGVEGVEWVLDPAITPHVDLVDGRPSRDLPRGVRTTATFTDEPANSRGFLVLRGDTGCNGYGIGYRVRPSGIAGVYRLETDGRLESTAQGCPEPETTVEQAVFSALGRAARVDLRDDRGRRQTGDAATTLALRDADNSLLLLFRRDGTDPGVADALRGAAWRFVSSERPDAGDGDGATLTFYDELYLGENGCARAGGAYTVDGDALTVGPTEYPPMCPAGAERTVPITSGTLTVTAGRLVVRDREGRETVYERGPEGAP